MIHVTPNDIRIHKAMPTCEQRMMSNETCPCFLHYSDVIMGALASQITSLTIVYSTVYSGVDQRKQQSSASLAICAGNSPVPVKIFPFDDVIMWMVHNRRAANPQKVLYLRSLMHPHTHLVCNAHLIANFLSFHMSLVVVVNYGAGNALRGFEISMFYFF